MVENITGLKTVQIEKIDEDDIITFNIKAPEESIGLIIGKNGKTIKTIRNLLKVRATLDKKKVNLTVSPL